VTEPAVHRDPAVDVVVPTRNRPELLRTALAAIRAQSHPGRVTTYVVFDQSEPDPSLGDDDPLRPVVVMTNTRAPGLAGARNSGILAGDGHLVAFCDDDDAWLPGKLEAQIEVLAGEPRAGLVSCGIRVRYEDRVVDRVLPVDRVRLADLLRSRLTELHPSTFLMRRQALVDDIGLVDEQVPGSYAEDYEFLLRAARYAPVLTVGRVLVEVRWHASSYFSSRWDTFSTALRWLLERYPEFSSEPRGAARVTGQIAFARAAAGRRRDAVRWAGRTIRYDVRQPRAYLALAVASGVVSADSIVRRLHARGRGL